MQKKILVFLFLIVCLSSTYAQTEKGTWMLGGTGAITNNEISQGSTFTFNLSPRVGYFVTPNWAIGVQTGFSIVRSTYQSPFTGEFKQNSWNLGFFTRYYFLPNRFKIFPHFDYERTWTRSKYPAVFGGNSSEQNIQMWQSNMGVGATYFLNSSIGIEALLRYQMLKQTPIVDQSGLGVQIGFQIYFGKNKVE